MGAIRRSRRTRERLIEAFRKTGRIDLACREAGVHHSLHYDWLKADPEYSQAFKAAEVEVVDMLEAEAWRRAKDGVEEPIYHAGKRVVEITEEPEFDSEGNLTGAVRKVERPASVVRYSDSLLIFLLKGRKREVYGDRSEVTGKDGTPLFGVDAVRSYMQSVPDNEE